MKSEVRSQNSEVKENISERTFDFALKIVSLTKSFKSGLASSVIAKQLLRSGTSIGANFRESRSAQSKKDFIHKLEVALKEAREAEYWLKLSKESELVSETLVKPVLVEIDELIKILVTIIRKVKGKTSDF